MNRVLLASAALLLTACDDRTVQSHPDRQVARPGARPAGASRPPPPPPPPAPSLAGLLPLTEAAISRELESGAGCSLEGGTAGPLLVAVSGDALVNDKGQLVHLRPEAATLAELQRGGRFAGGGLSVEVQREAEVERVDEVTSWSATVRVKRDESSTAQIAYHHRWSCGA